MQKINEYNKARSVRNTKFTDLIAKNMMNNKGLLSSTKSAIGGKLSAEIVGIKEKFNPISIAKRFTGNLGATLVGKMLGRSKTEISHFTGLSAGKSEDPLHTKVSDGQKQRMRKGDAIADVLAKLYNVTKQYREEDVKRMELDDDFKKTKQEEKEKWQNDMLEALKSLSKMKPSAVKTEDKNNFLSKLMDTMEHAIETKLEMKLGEKIFNSVWKRITGALVGEAVVAGEGAVAVGAGIPVAAVVGGIIAAAAGGYFLGEHLKEKLKTKEDEVAFKKGGAKAVDAQQRMRDNLIPMMDQAEGGIIPLSDEWQKAKDDYDDATKGYKEEPSVPKVKSDNPILQTPAPKSVPEKTTATPVRGGPMVKAPTTKPVKATTTPVPSVPTVEAPTAKPVVATPKIVTQKATAEKKSPYQIPDKVISNIEKSPKVKPVTTSNVLAKKVQELIDKNNDLKIEEKKTNKTFMVDNSKKINNVSQADSDFKQPGSIPVRSDEDTLRRTLKSNYRPV
jgi:hypothetical protein